MSSYQVTATGDVPAPADRVYALLADYRVGHPSILPRPWFERLDVEAGGVGEGTVIRVAMRVFGLRAVYRARVSEPQPGRVLAETDLATGSETTFTVAPRGPAACAVTITTTRPARGLAGAVDRLLLARLLPRVFRAELARLAAHPWEGVRAG